LPSKSWAAPRFARQIVTHGVTAAGVPLSPSGDSGKSV